MDHVNAAPDPALHVPFHRPEEELAAGLASVRAAPRDGGRVDLIVARPTTETRSVLETGTFDVERGLVGDCWLERGSSRGGPAKLDAQIALMSSRVAALLAGPEERWPLAGDQLFVDLDLSAGALPAGTLLAIGPAVLEVTELPHTGCAKFSGRFGSAALRLASTPEGRDLRLRGIYARVVRGGEIRRGDAIQVTRPA